MHSVLCAIVEILLIEILQIMQVVFVKWAKQTILERALAIWKLVTWFLIFMTSQCAFQSFLFIMCLVCDVIICGHVPGAILHAYL